MRIGEVAAHAGVSVQTVRLYERLGLLRQVRRLPSGYRVYSMEAVHFIRFIKKAQERGFTLKEIKRLTELRGQNPDSIKRLQDLIKTKIDVIDEKIRRLETQRNAIEFGINNCSCSEKYPLCLLPKTTDQNSSADE